MTGVSALRARAANAAQHAQRAQSSWSNHARSVPFTVCGLKRAPNNKPYISASAANMNASVKPAVVCLGKARRRLQKPAEAHVVFWKAASGEATA